MPSRLIPTAIAVALGVGCPALAQDTANPPPGWLQNFGLAVLRAQDSDDTRLISPIGLATVIAMLADGTDTDTEATALGLAGADPLGAVSGHWRAVTSGDHGATIRVASGVWLAPDFSLRDSFAARQQAALSARVARVDFTQPQTLSLLNDWFAEATSGMIPQLLDDLPPDTRIVLGNALALQGRWETAFDPGLTIPAPFTAGDGTQHTVDLMRREGVFEYRETADHSAVILPFAGDVLTVTLYLPTVGTPLETLLEPGGALASADGFEPRVGRVEVPRLNLRAGGNLSETLRGMGMLTGTHYPRLTPEPLVIGPVIHRTAMTLDEQGVEAAAATAAIGLRTAGAEGFVLRLDRPFALAITHRPSDTPVFMGLVVTP